MLNATRRSLCAGVCVAALTISGTAFATPTSHPTDTPNQQVAVDAETGAQRSAVPVEGVGLRLNTQPGDQITVSGGVVTWLDSDGDVVATISLSAEQGDDMNFAYDPVTHMIAPKASYWNGSNNTSTFAKCMPKWWGWFYNIAWGTLVCAPASLGASGIATPIAGIATAAACEAAGGALTTAISC